MRRIIVFEKSFDAGLAGDLGRLARTHAIGDRHGDALGFEQGGVGNDNAIGIVVALLSASLRVLADGDRGTGLHALSSTIRRVALTPRLSWSRNRPA